MTRNSVLIVVAVIVLISAAAFSAAVRESNLQTTPLAVDGSVFRSDWNGKSANPRLESLELPQTVVLKQWDYESDCTVFVDYPQYALYDWLEGMELYSVYQDLRFPLVDCDTTYPFVITDIGMTLVLNVPGTLWVAVLVQEVDPVYSSDVCPIPGEVIAMSDIYPVVIPEPNVYSLTIALETPVPVYEPWFAGFYFASDIRFMYPGIAIDTVPYICLNYNDWGYGYYDLASNDYYNFPGSIHLYSVGYSKLDRIPQPRFVLPPDSGRVVPGQAIWAAELQDNPGFASAKFEYYAYGSWHHFGSDFDGAVSLRSGVTPSLPGDGWSSIFNPFGLPEGNYLMRVSVADIDSTFVSDTIVAFLDLNDLTPEFISHADFQVACGPETLEVSIEDENPVAVSFGFRPMPANCSWSLPLLNRNHYGDENGDPDDGNYSWNGEFGDYYSPPCVATAMIKHWYDAGFIELMIEDATFLTIDQVVEQFAERFGTRRNYGTEDDNFVAGLIDYVELHTDRVDVAIARAPGWEWLKRFCLGQTATVAFALDNPFGHWLAVRQIDYIEGTVDSFPVVLYDPIGALLRDSYILVENDSLQIGYLPNNRKYPVALAVALYPVDDTTTYDIFGTDFDPIDGFSTILPEEQFHDDFRYLIRARAIDADNDIADNFLIIDYDCEDSWLAGDADGNGVVEVSDPAYIIAYIFSGGPAPVPTLLAGDADCNHAVDIADVVFLIAYIFTQGPAPCSH